MDFLLRNNLPIELADSISRDVHQRYMDDLVQEILFNVVWVRTNDGEYSFLIGKTSNNPFYVLRSYIPANFKDTGYRLF